MKKRQISKKFLSQLQSMYLPLTELVRKDDTLDMEFRGDSVIVYYRGGKVLELSEAGVLSPLDAKYGKINAALTINNVASYCMEAKHLIDIYQNSTKNNLGEKEISQRIVMENNYSPYSYDTDYFIVDMEYNDGFQFDLIALKWPSTAQAHKSKECSISIIETKQGINTLRTTNDNPGINEHYSDFTEFIKNNDMTQFCSDMLMIFKQKCILGLIKKINEPSSSLKIDLDTQFALQYNQMEFVAVLANYKKASSRLIDELKSMPQNNECKFATSSFMGYGLYLDNIVEYKEFLALL